MFVFMYICVFVNVCLSYLEEEGLGQGSSKSKKLIDSSQIKEIKKIISDETNFEKKSIVKNDIFQRYLFILSEKIDSFQLIILYKAQLIILRLLFLITYSKKIKVILTH